MGSKSVRVFLVNLAGLVLVEDVSRLCVRDWRGRWWQGGRVGTATVLPKGVQVRGAVDRGGVRW